VFGLEGCEALIPALYSIVESASKFGLSEVEMGMTHRYYDYYYDYYYSFYKN